MPAKTSATIKKSTTPKVKLNVTKTSASTKSLATKAPKRVAKSTKGATAKSFKTSKNFAMPTDAKGGQLIIVESPAKAQTIKRFLGKGYEVVASMGHVSDLPKKNIGIDIAKNFTPTYEIAANKKVVIQ